MRERGPARDRMVKKKARTKRSLPAGGGPPAPNARATGIAPDHASAFRRRLHAWYRRHARDLPWRRTRDPYHVLVSELMLQQTQVSRVLDFYRRFLERFPSLADVARARPARVREAWAGLGYYARARNLHRLAREVTDTGRAPGRTASASSRS